DFVDRRNICRSDRCKNKTQIMPNDKVTSICILDIVCSGGKQSLMFLNALNSLLIPTIVSVKRQVTLIFLFQLSL
ncbi:MAG: hypothetical protein WBX29_01930, partial [Nitrososphaeraceae archaeon]